MHSRYSGYLRVALLFRGSYYLGVYIGGSPIFVNPRLNTHTVRLRIGLRCRATIDMPAQGPLAG